jgi:hypothetical protein
LGKDVTEVSDDRFLLSDTKPAPVVGYKRSKQHSDFRASAGYGYCSARHFHYFGYKFVAVTSFDGLLIMYELVVANIDERDAAEDVFDYLRHCAMFGGKGLIGADWQAEAKEQISNRSGPRSVSIRKSRTRRGLHRRFALDVQIFEVAVV